MSTRKSHCLNGHPRTPENVTAKRGCRLCRNERARLRNQTPEWKAYYRRWYQDNLDRSRQYHSQGKERRLRRGRDLRIDPTGINQAKFWPQVDRSGGPDSCWEWQGCVGPGGYGLFDSVAAHRVARALTEGKIDAGIVLHHACENKVCVNPKHLEPMTPSEHARHHRSKAAA